jgi:hypothetical protein
LSRKIAIENPGYVLWLMPDPASADKIQKIIHHLSDHFSSPCFAPHITLSSVPERPLSEIKDKMKLLAESVSSFQVTANKPECGEAPFQRFSSEVTPEKYFHDLSNKSDDLFGGDFGKKQFFHLSLLYGYTSCTDIKNYMKRLDDFYDHNLYIQSISLVYCQGPPQEWKIIHSEKFS